MAYDYESIKNIAKELGVKVTDLLALAPQNDPFYVGTAGDIEMARWFATIWQRTGYSTGVHLRRIHYWTVSQNPAVLMPNGLYNGGEGLNKDEIAAVLSVSSRSISGYLSDIDKQLREERKERIFDMWLGSYTGSEIAEVLEIDEKTVTNTLSGITEDLPKFQKVHYE